VEVGDLLVQRLKACMIAAQEGSWNTARWWNYFLKLSMPSRCRTTRRR
jgi:hypothetical protein